MWCAYVLGHIVISRSALLTHNLTTVTTEVMKIKPEILPEQGLCIKQILLLWT